MVTMHMLEMLLYCKLLLILFGSEIYLKLNLKTLNKKVVGPKNVPQDLAKSQRADHVDESNQIKIMSLQKKNAYGILESKLHAVFLAKLVREFI